MRTGIVLGFKQGSGKPEIIADQSESYPTVRAAYKKAVLTGGDGFDRIELWDSTSGRVKKKVFRAGPTGALPAEKPRRGRPAKPAE